MLNRSASLAMSTSVLKALPGKLDIKRHSPNILYLFSRVSFQVSLGQSLKSMMQSEFQDRLGDQKSIFTSDKSINTNDISLILGRDPMIGYIWSHAPP